MIESNTSTFKKVTQNINHSLDLLDIVFFLFVIGAEALGLVEATVEMN